MILYKYLSIRYRRLLYVQILELFYDQISEAFLSGYRRILGTREHKTRVEAVLNGLYGYTRFSEIWEEAAAGLANIGEYSN